MTIEDNTSSLAIETKVATVIAEMRDDILFGFLKARERLVELDLSDRFDAKRHVIRAALEELEREGLVFRHPNRGAVVADPSMQDFEHLYDIRHLLEREAVKHVQLPAPPEFVQELRSLNFRFRLFLESGDLKNAAAMNRQFHALMFSIGPSPILAETISKSFCRTARVYSFTLRNLTSAMRSYEEHNQMIDAIEVGDRARLVECVVSHMRNSFDLYKAYYV